MALFQNARKGLKSCCKEKRRNCQNLGISQISWVRVRSKEKTWESCGSEKSLMQKFHQLQLQAHLKYLRTEIFISRSKMPFFEFWEFLRESISSRPESRLRMACRRRNLWFWLNKRSSTGVLRAPWSQATEKIIWEEFEAHLNQPRSSYQFAIHGSNEGRAMAKHGKVHKLFKMKRDPQSTQKLQVLSPRTHRNSTSLEVNL